MKLEAFSERRYDLLALISLLLLCGVVYSATYQVPWYFDDYANIAGNLVVRSPARIPGLLFLPRGPALLSFAANYALHGETLFGYHLVNNLIHAVASWMVYLILKRLSGFSRGWALVAAMLFLAHPIQTQAVTYIVQRMTSLAALFAFMCLYCCIRGRELLGANGRWVAWPHLAWYGAMALSCVLAVATKQNTAFLPIGLYVFSRYFIDDRQGWSRRRTMAYLSPFVIPPLLIGYRALLVPFMKGVPLSQIGSMGSKANPFYYCVTEWKALWIYLRLLILPYGQTLDYNYPLVAQIVSLPVLAAGCGLVLLAFLAWRLRCSAPWLSFAITWFFCSLAVESTLLPLDTLFEHRLYLPMFGFVACLVRLLTLIPHRQLRSATVILLLTGYSLLSMQRNDLWGDPIAFNEDNLRKAPRNERIYLELSRLYIEKQRYAEAEQLLRKGLEINPRFAKLYDNLGNLYDLKHESARAIEFYKQGIAIDPSYEKLYINLAVVHAAQGELEQADALLEKAISIRDTNPSAYFNRGVVQYRLGRRQAALESFQRALDNAPFDQDVIYNLAMVAAETGQQELASAMLNRLKAISPQKSAELQREMGAAPH